MIQTKRNDLERFISEQTIGPGVSGYRFINLNDDRLLAAKMSEQNPIDYGNEILNIVPGAVYSTGILFPLDDSKIVENNGLVNLHEKEEANDSITDDGDSNVTSKEMDESSLEDDDSMRIDQMFPNTMGLTCCFSDEVLNRQNIVIKVQARYYTKIDKTNPNFNSDYGILCECDSQKFREFIANTVLETVFQITERGSNEIITIKGVSDGTLAEARSFIKKVNTEKAQEIFVNLKGYSLPVRSVNLSALKQSCFYELKNSIIDTDKRRELYMATQQIEQIENIVSHINDLLDVNDSRSYGLWQSKSIEVDVPFPVKLDNDLKGKKIYNFNKHPHLKDIFSHSLADSEELSLSLNLQLSTGTRNNRGKIFLKVQLKNTSTAFSVKEGDSRYYSTFNEKVNQKAFFGVKLSIANQHLVPYNSVDFAGMENKNYEDIVTKFIYRQFEDFGIGHGCSVKWSKESNKIETEYLPAYSTPEVEATPKNKEEIFAQGNIFEPMPILENTRALEFKWLSLFSKASDDEIIQGLKEFILSYEKWIERKRIKYQKCDDAEKRIAFDELDKCSSDRKRMESNIEQFLVGEFNRHNMESFRLMNSAMFMQLWHSAKTKNEGVTQFIDNPDFQKFDSSFYQAASDQLFPGQKSASWRAFQLAFIILNLDGIFNKPSDSTWESRNEWVDLVWFPTGGGKTEAYLGIIALTIINRRRQHHDQGGGTAVLMRYTLRLLTLQQFQRATLLIMALELIRRWNSSYGLGAEPIFVGLWVGDNSLPNSMKDLIDEFRKLSQGAPSKIPFNRCPWCNSKLNPANQEESDEGKPYYFNRLHLMCSNEKCSFSFSRPARARTDQGPIPVSLCDDEIYQHPPALLFGTVDKFAQLAHKVTNESSKRNKDSRRLFGKGNWEPEKPQEGYLPPDLIIQDELHLLLGPLGSAVALFESAIDQLCRRSDGTRPKIISSTATTRNTPLQIMALFDRKVNLFPKPGVECDDSFFAFYKRRFENSKGDNEVYASKRRYIGILPTGRTQIWMQMRLAAIMLTHRALFELNQLTNDAPIDFESYERFQKAIDYFHTVVSYFNSLKEVGKTESQIHTYLVKEIRRVFNRVIRPQKLIHALYTYSIREAELTGRLTGEQVKSELERVSSSWKADKRFAHPELKDGLITTESGRTPPDFVVATNMISVGIDIGRFNQIIINSMPRNIAEYIQASSRVARESYGLVLTVHHPFRARDMSHYEKFIEFHEKMYSYVEPISITPFTKKAIERYLGLYLATMIRHTEPSFTNRGTAREITKLNDQQKQEFVKRISDYFEKRRVHLESISSDVMLRNLLKEGNVKDINDWIKQAILDWATYANGKNLVFNNKSKITNPPQDQLYIDMDEYDGNIHSEKWQVPASLRVIEPEAALKIKLK